MHTCTHAVETHNTNTKSECATKKKQMHTHWLAIWKNISNSRFRILVRKVVRRSKPKLRKMFHPLVDVRKVSKFCCISHVPKPKAVISDKIDFLWWRVTRNTRRICQDFFHIPENTRNCSFSIFNWDERISKCLNGPTQHSPDKTQKQNRCRVDGQNYSETAVHTRGCTTNSSTKLSTFLAALVLLASNYIFSFNHNLLDPKFGFSRESHRLLNISWTFVFCGWLIRFHFNKTYS